MKSYFSVNSGLIIILLTIVAQCVCESRFTSSFTVTSLFVTRRLIQTVSATVVDTVRAIGPVLTYYMYINRKKYVKFSMKIEVRVSWSPESQDCALLCKL